MFLKAQELQGQGKLKPVKTYEEAFVALQTSDGFGFADVPSLWQLQFESVELHQRTCSPETPDVEQL